MDPVTVSLAAAGLLSSLLGNAAAQHKQQVTGEMQAAQQKAAPWLAKVGASAGNTQTEFAPPIAGSAIQGILGGIGQGQAIQNAAEKNAAQKAMEDYYSNAQMNSMNLNGSNMLNMGAGSPAINGVGGFSLGATPASAAGLNEDVLNQLLAANSSKISTPTIYGGP